MKTMYLNDLKPENRAGLSDMTRSLQLKLTASGFSHVFFTECRKASICEQPKGVVVPTWQELLPLACCAVLSVSVDRSSLCCFISDFVCIQALCCFISDDEHLANLFLYGCGINDRMMSVICGTSHQSTT